MKLLNITIILIFTFFPYIAKAQQGLSFYGLQQAEPNHPPNIQALKNKCIKDLKNKNVLVIPSLVSKDIFRPRLGDKLCVFQKSKLLGWTEVKKLYIDTYSEEIAGPEEDKVCFETDKSYSYSDKFYPIFIQVPNNLKTEDLPSECKTKELTEDEVDKACDELKDKCFSPTITINFTNKNIKTLIGTSTKANEENITFAIFKKGKWKINFIPKGEEVYSFDQAFKVKDKYYFVLDWVSSGSMGMAVFEINESGIKKVYSTGHAWD